MSNIAKWIIIALAVMGAYITLELYIPQVNNKAFDFGTTVVYYKHLIVIFVLAVGVQMKMSKS